MTDAPHVQMGAHVFGDVRARAQALMPGDEGARELYIACTPPLGVDHGVRTVLLLPAAQDFMRRECPDLVHRWPEVFGPPAYDGHVTAGMIGARVIGRRIAGVVLDECTVGVVLDDGSILRVLGSALTEGAAIEMEERSLRPSELAMAALEREGAKSGGGG